MAMDASSPEDGMKNRWHLVHEYQNLANDDLVPPLVCPEDNDHYVWPVIDPNGDDPAFYCGACDITIYPGINVWDQIEATVRDARP